MKSLLIVGVFGASLGLIIIIFKLLKKGGKVLSKLPTNFMIFFLVYAILGLMGFFFKNQITESPILVAMLLVLGSLIGGLIMTNHLYETWAWSMAALFWKKLLYLSGITLISMLAFALAFLFSEHRGMWKGSLAQDIVWPLLLLILTILLPLLIKQLHLLWEEIPKMSQLKHYFQIPINESPPFIETGGATVKFLYVIPLEFRSKELVKAKVAVPMDKTLEAAFHYKVHEHNIVRKFAKKIIYAEENKRSKVYGWYFYKTESTWWGLWIKKIYLNPSLRVGGNISSGDKIYVERVKAWER